MAKPTGLDARLLVYPLLGAAVGFAAVWFGMPLIGAIEEEPTIRLATAVVAALFLAFCGFMIGRGGAANARLRAAFDPDVGDEPDPTAGQTYATGEAVSDAELAQAAREAASRGRRERMASVASVAVPALVMIALGAGVSALDLEVSGGLVVGIFVLGIAAGVVAHRALTPRSELDPALASIDLDAPIEGGPSFDELLGGATRLTISRRSGWISIFGREHTLTADDTMLATATQELAWLRAILPSWLAPYGATIAEGDTRLTVDKGVLSPVYRVKGLACGEATLRSTFRGWRLTADGVALELKEPWFFGNEVAIWKNVERIGYAQVRVAQGLAALLAGSELAIDVELPSGATLAERQLLAVAFVVFDRRVR